MQEVDGRKLRPQWQVRPNYIRFESDVKNSPTYLRKKCIQYFIFENIFKEFLICRCLKLLAWIVCNLSECFRCVFKGDRHAILEAEVDSPGSRAWGRVGGFENEVRIVSERTTEGGNCKKEMWADRIYIFVFPERMFDQFRSSVLARRSILRTIPVSHSVQAFHFQLQTTLDAAELEAENERKLRVSAEMLCRELEEKLESLKTGKSQSVQNAQAVQEVNRYERVSTLKSIIHHYSSSWAINRNCSLW